MICSRQNRERREIFLPTYGLPSLPGKTETRDGGGDREDKAKLQAAAALKTLGADPERMNCVEHTFKEALDLGWFSCDQNRFATARSKLLVLEDGRFHDVVDIMSFVSEE